MSTSPEALTNLELPSVAQAEAFLMASCIVLGRDDVTHVDINAGRRMSRNGHNVVGGMVNISNTDDGPEGFTLSWFHGVQGEKLILGQVLLDGDEASHLQVSIRRKTDDEHGRAYTTILSAGTSREPTRKLNDAETNKERAHAEALLVTMASDFKSALQIKLADRPDLLDGIEWNAADMQNDHKGQKTKLSGWLGRLTS